MKERPEEIEEWYEKAEPILKEYGYIKNKKWKLLLFLLLGIGIGLLTFYAINTGFFTDLENPLEFIKNMTGK